MLWSFKKKKHPDFWITYLAHFDKKEKKNLHTSRFVALDSETTGFDIYKDRILSIGAVSIVGNEISVADTFEVYLKQSHFNPETVHIHGILQHGTKKKLSEEEALKQFLIYIKDSVLVAHHAIFDIKMINQSLNRMGLPNLKNKVIDTMELYADTRIKSNFIDKNIRYSLDDIAEAYAINLTDRHTAPGDALIAALIFLKTTTILRKSKYFKLEHYFLKSNRF
ncbi:3'-5' exonuclease [Gelidibacter maritimus]|uniref:3'-5' exonuclease n=1 Tax=Gelidibacter maritimus TaxID=2761487 RepID=A0A7W2M4G2_9FLAO|nr:3'-5' exonuclease [Gelidibacter maritimus]MBA6152528.1 3'-5' exonuclease [Gelidibacter maritimus]